MSAKASGASPNGAANGEAKHRQHHDGSTGRAFTVEQKTAVIRVRKCAPTAFYDILGLEEVKTTCTDGEIKKAYRKLSLLTHPDKNGYDGADEAFKMVSRAFQILSDPDKKSKFDKFGGDPDNRFGGGSASTASPFSGFGRSGGAARAGGPMWEEEISPEEMFRQFFGGGGMGGGFGGPFGGGLFDTGPGFVFNLGGGPGIRVQQFGGNRPRRRPHNHDSNAPQQPAPSAASALQSLLPLLLLFLLPLLSSLFSSTSNTGPSLRFDSPIPPHTLQHTSARLKVPYWVNPSDVADYTPKKWRELDKAAEVKYVGELDRECEAEVQRRNAIVQQAQGFFWTDHDALDQARRMEMRSCRRLNELGYGGAR
ncbi:hypothetical protein B0A49_10715 [Cryomyces minteri]|uniref:J domain-containing protein n=2 Tax=Cryomyces minteri TaxID=331657 RepID=A0A4U0VTD7_9PEZI|nr:hypothetical protein B0A49_10715 [Cryomyces minteri]